jgi:hypothetical protein
MTRNPFADTIQRVSDTLDADILAYFGDINDAGADEICAKLISPRRKNILLILGTYGGDPDAAYRIARRIQRAYKTQKKFKSEGDARFFVFLPTVCKSAGTLIVLGADQIYISRDAEVGPIDIQIRKHDEVGERASGLLPSEALNALAGRARQAFLQQFRGLRTDANLPFSTKLAAEVASNMTVGLFKPIFEQIDPLRLAEMERSQRIAAEYGKRLAVGNLAENALVRLLAEYPSHSFIIDSEEMKEIFKNVSEADAHLEDLSDKVEVLYRNFTHNTTPLVMLLDASQWQSEEADDDQPSAGEGEADGAGAGDASSDVGGVSGDNQPATGSSTPEAGNDDSDDSANEGVGAAAE